MGENRRDIHDIRIRPRYLKLPTPHEETVALDRLLVGSQDGHLLEQWILKSHEYSRASLPLVASPYVTLLEACLEQPLRRFDSGFLRSTDYFRMALTCARRGFGGHWFFATDEEGILDRVRAYVRQFDEARVQGQIPATPYADSRRAITVRRVRDSEWHEIGDGHHRAGIAWALGRRTVPVRVLAEKWTYLQALVLAGGQTHEDKVLRQPIDRPEFDDSWRVARRCTDRWTSMRSFLRERNLLGHLGSVLDVGCSYGWFLHRFREEGLEPHGVEEDAALVLIGRSAFDLPEGAVVWDSIERFLASTDTTHDVVLFMGLLHSFGLGLRTYSEGGIPGLLQRLDAVTGKVLFFESGQGHERSLQRQLPEWTADYLRELVLAHTTFREAVALGVDSDREHHPGEYGRTLFAFLR